MIYLKNNISFILLAACILSCKQNEYRYPQNRKVADENGFLKDSLGLYFSTYAPFDSSQIDFVDFIPWQRIITANLNAFKEPVYFNDYLGKEQYRFIWLPSFNLPIVFTIAKDNKNLYLTTKRLDRQPLLEDVEYFGDIPEFDSAYSSLGYHLIKDTANLKNVKGETVKDVRTLIKADGKANLSYHEKKFLKKHEWTKFKNLLKQANFWKIKSYDNGGDSDGAIWIIEANTKEAYRFLVRIPPNDKVKKVGEMLLLLSGLKEELY